MSHKIWNKGNKLFYFSLFYHYTLILYFYFFLNTLYKFNNQVINASQIKKRILREYSTIS